MNKKYKNRNIINFGKYAGCLLGLSCSLYGQKIAVVSTDTKNLNEELLQVFRAAGGKGIPNPIGSIIKIVEDDRTSKPVTLKVGKSASCRFFKDGEKLLVTSNTSSGYNVKVSAFETKGGAKTSEFDILGMHKFGNGPNFTNGKRFSFSDMLVFEKSDIFVLAAEDPDRYALPRKPGVGIGIWGKIVVFDDKRLLMERDFEAPIATAHLSKLNEEGKGLVEVLSWDGLGNTGLFKRQHSEFLIGNELNLKQVKKPVSSASTEGSVAVIPIQKAKRSINIVQTLGDETHRFRKGRKMLTSIKLYLEGEKQPIKTIRLNYSVVAIRLNKNADKLVVLSQEKPQIQIFSTENLRQLEKIDHIIDNPTDCVVW
jgi:hypothetical protein